MREIFLEYSKRGAMTMEEVADVLRRKPDWVRRHSSGSNATIPRLPGKPIRFDPVALIKVFCEPQAPQKSRSLTTEKRSFSGNLLKGGFRKCL